eukprot:207735-Chlamydomonas_euryale.AAC.1
MSIPVWKRARHTPIPPHSTALTMSQWKRARHTPPYHHTAPHSPCRGGRSPACARTPCPAGFGTCSCALCSQGRTCRGPFPAAKTEHITKKGGWGGEVGRDVCVFAHGQGSGCTGTFGFATAFALLLLL